MAQSTQLSWSCTCCGRKFGRKEHLERHMHRHLQLKPFRCTLCTESFARRDTLLRHSTVHGERGDELRQHLVNQSKRRAQACYNCAKSKLRCEGTFPCNRCMKNSLTCQIKTIRPSRRPQNSHRSTVHEDPDGRIASSTPLETPANTFVNTDTPGPDTSNLRLSPIPQPTVVNENEALREQIPIPTRLTTPENGSPMLLHENDQTREGNDMLSPVQFDYHIQEQDTMAYYNTDAWSTDFSDLFMSPLLWFSCPDDTSQEEPLAQSNGTRQVTGLSRNDCLPAAGMEDSHTHNICPMVEQIVETELMPRTDDISLRHHENSSSHITPAEEEIIACEDFCHVNQLSPTSYSTCEQFYAQLQDARKSSLPSIRVMHAFVELYFEYFDKNFPCIHPNQLEQDDTSWILLLAVSSVGAQYSALPGADECVRSLHFLLEQAVSENIPPYSRSAKLSFVQSVLIRDISRSFSGLKSQQTKLEYERNLLFTLQRGLNPRHQILYTRKIAAEDDSTDDWDAWFKLEATTRLNLCINRLQVLQFALFDMKPTTRDLNFAQQPLPPTARWTSRNDAEWTRKCHQSLVDAEAPKFFEITCLMSSISVERIQRMDRMSDMSLARYLQSSYSNGHMNSAPACPWPDAAQPIINRPGFTSTLINSALHKWLDDPITRRIDSHSGKSDDCFLHIMAILRHVPLRAIYAYSGWEADENEIKEAETFLSNWIQNNSRSTRTCLWHASSSLRILRNKIHFSCSDPFVILIAGLVVWTYCKLGPCADNGNQVGNHPNPKEEKIPVRIDQLSDEAEINAWINGENPAIHLTGFGALMGPRSAHRVMTELDKILHSKIGWKVIRHGLAYNMRQVASGERPGFQEEQDL